MRHRIGLVTLALTLVPAVLLLGEEVKRVSKHEALAAAVTRIQPEYPPVARQLKLTGTVEVEVAIDEQGAATGAKQLSGNPLLAKAAVEAVRKWRFKPFRSDGRPTKAAATLSFVFGP
jgi:periplasmic protein TonB